MTVGNNLKLSQDCQYDFIAIANLTFCLAFHFYLENRPATRSTNVGAVRFAVRFAQNAPEMGICKATCLWCVLKCTAPPLVERVHGAVTEMADIRDM